MVGLDKDNTHILLIGTSRYPRWPEMDIPNIEVNLNAVSRLFLDPFYCGVSPEKIKIVHNENLEDTNFALHDFFNNIRSTKATVILYYAGHGLISTKAIDDLFLSTKNIRAQAFEASSIKVSELRAMFADCIATKKILLIDCCYAGKITRGFMGGDRSHDIQKFSDFEGTYILASSSEYERSKFDVDNPTIPTEFTGEFLDVVTNGIESEDEYCTLNSIYKRIEDSLRNRQSSPKPIQLTKNNIGTFPIFRNKKFHDNQQKIKIEWEKTIDIDSIASYRAFLSQFPASRYSQVAREKIMKISSQQNDRHNIGELNISAKEDNVHAGLKSKTKITSPFVQEISDTRIPTPAKRRYLLVITTIVLTVLGIVWGGIKIRQPRASKNTNDSTTVNSNVSSPKRLLSSALLEKIKIFSSASPNYNPYFGTLLDSIEQAPDYQKEIDYVKIFISKCEKAKQDQ